MQPNPSSTHQPTVNLRLHIPSRCKPYPLVKLNSFSPSPSWKAKHFFLPFSSFPSLSHDRSQPPTSYLRVISPKSLTLLAIELLCRDTLPPSPSFKCDFLPSVELYLYNNHSFHFRRIIPLFDVSLLQQDSIFDIGLTSAY